MYNLSGDLNDLFCMAYVCILFPSIHSSTRKQMHGVCHTTGIVPTYVRTYIKCIECSVYVTGIPYRYFCQVNFI